MNEKITAQPPKEERQEVLKEIRQLENRKKILENKQRNEERRVRTRRLIERGAILEHLQEHCLQNNNSLLLHTLIYLLIVGKSSLK